jgi:hypothetical protein
VLGVRWSVLRARRRALLLWGVPTESPPRPRQTPCRRRGGAGPGLGHTVAQARQTQKLARAAAPARQPNAPRVVCNPRRGNVFGVVAEINSDAGHFSEVTVDFLRYRMGGVAADDFRRRAPPGHRYARCRRCSSARRRRRVGRQPLEGTVNLRSCGRSANRISLISHTRPGESQRRTRRKSPSDCSS